MTTQRDIDSLLEQVAKASERGGLISKSVVFEGLLGDDSTDYNWREIPASQSRTLQAAVRLGLLSETYRPFDENYPGQLAPDGGDFLVELTGPGEERLLKLNEPWWHEAWRQITSSLYSIVTAVIISLLVSYAAFYAGPEKRDAREAIGTDPPNDVQTGTGQ